MSAGHTEGRLQVRQIDDEFVVGTDLPPGEGRYAVAALIRKEPDARRLAACWNACEGMTTEALEALPGPFNKLLSQEFLSLVDQLAAARVLLADVRDENEAWIRESAISCSAVVHDANALLARIRAFLAGEGA